jgi:hypothetical protein
MNTITRTQRHVCQQEIHNSGLSWEYDSCSAGQEISRLL